MDYRAYFFDFDGVLADSVAVKTQAFAQLFQDFGADMQERVVRHHLKNGGMSRFEKFQYYYKEYLNIQLSDMELQTLCNKFASLVVDKVVVSPEIPGSYEFLQQCSRGSVCFVISATPEKEIRQIVKRRGIADFFQDILGSPTGKAANLSNLINTYGLDPSECVFFGDAESDYCAASECHVDFFGILPGKEAPLLNHYPQLQWFHDFHELLASGY